MFDDLNPTRTKAFIWAYFASTMALFTFIAALVLAWPATRIVESPFLTATVLTDIGNYFRFMAGAPDDWLFYLSDWIDNRVLQVGYPPEAIIGSVFLAAGVGALLGFVNPWEFDLTSHGSARFARDKDIKRMRMRGAQGMVLGALGWWLFRQYLRNEETLSALLLAPPGTGKTAAIAIPTILTYDRSSMVINDIKGELFEKTSGYRSTVGFVYRIEWAARGGSRWNPLASSEVPEDEAMSDLYLGREVNVLIQSKGGGQDDHWIATAQAACIGFSYLQIGRCRAQTAANAKRALLTNRPGERFVVRRRLEDKTLDEVVLDFQRALKRIYRDPEGAYEAIQRAINAKGWGPTQEQLEIEPEGFKDMRFGTLRGGWLPGTRDRLDAHVWEASQLLALWRQIEAGRWAVYRQVPADQPGIDLAAEGDLFPAARVEAGDDDLPAIYGEGLGPDVAWISAAKRLKLRFRVLEPTFTDILEMVMTGSLGDDEAEQPTQPKPRGQQEENKFDTFLKRCIAEIKGKVEPPASGTAGCEPPELEPFMVDKGFVRYPKRALLELGQLLQTPAEERGSIISTMIRSLNVFKIEAVKRSTSACDFTLNDVRGALVGGGGVPVTVYLCVSVEDKDALSVVTGLFLEALAARMVAKGPKKNQFAVGFILDECPQLPRLDNAVLSLPAVGRGQKCWSMIIGQDFGQFERKYEKSGVEELKSTTAWKIALPQNNLATAKELAEMTGQRTIRQKNRSRPSFFQFGPKQGGNVSIQETGQPLLRPEDLLGMENRFGRGHHIVLVQKFINMPIVCKTPFYFKSPTLRRRTEMPPRSRRLDFGGTDESMPTVTPQPSGTVGAKTAAAGGGISKATAVPVAPTATREESRKARRRL